MTGRAELGAKLLESLRTQRETLVKDYDALLKTADEIGKRIEGDAKAGTHSAKIIAQMQKNLELHRKAIEAMRKELQQVEKNLAAPGAPLPELNRRLRHVESEKKLLGSLLSTIAEQRDKTFEVIRIGDFRDRILATTSRIGFEPLPVLPPRDAMNEKQWQETVKKWQGQMQEYTKRTTFLSSPIWGPGSEGRSLEEAAKGKRGYEHERLHSRDIPGWNITTMYGVYGDYLNRLQVLSSLENPTPHQAREAMLVRRMEMQMGQNIMLQSLVANFLSTSHTYATLVERGEIEGPNRNAFLEHRTKRLVDFAHDAMPRWQELHLLNYFGSTLVFLQWRIRECNTELAADPDAERRKIVEADRKTCLEEWQQILKNLQSRVAAARNPDNVLGRDITITTPDGTRRTYTGLRGIDLPPIPMAEPGSDQMEEWIEVLSKGFIPPIRGQMNILETDMRQIFTQTHHIDIELSDGTSVHVAPHVPHALLLSALQDRSSALGREIAEGVTEEEKAKKEIEAKFKAGSKEAKAEEAHRKEAREKMTAEQLRGRIDTDRRIVGHLTFYTTTTLPLQRQLMMLYATQGSLIPAGAKAKAEMAEKVRPSLAPGLYDDEPGGFNLTMARLGFDNMAGMQREMLEQHLKIIGTELDYLQPGGLGGTLFDVIMDRISSIAATIEGLPLRAVGGIHWLYDLGLGLPVWDYFDPEITAEGVRKGEGGFRAGLLKLLHGEDFEQQRGLRMLADHLRATRKTLSEIRSRHMESLQKIREAIQTAVDALTAAADLVQDKTLEMEADAEEAEKANAAVKLAEQLVRDNDTLENQQALKKAQEMQAQALKRLKFSAAEREKAIEVCAKAATALIPPFEQLDKFQIDFHEDISTILYSAGLDWRVWEASQGLSMGRVYGSLGRRWAVFMIVDGILTRVLGGRWFLTSGGWRILEPLYRPAIAPLRGAYWLGERGVKLGARGVRAGWRALMAPDPHPRARMRPVNRRGGRPGFLDLSPRPRTIPASGLTRAPIATNEAMGTLARNLGADGADVTKILRDAAERRLITLTPRELRLIEGSPGVRGAFAGVSTADELAEAVRLTRATSTRPTVLRAGSALFNAGMLGLDVFALMMAWERFEENGRNLEMARKTGNVGLQALYASARAQDLAHAGTCLIVSGVTVASYGGLVSISTATGVGIIALPVFAWFEINAGLHEAAAFYLKTAKEWAMLPPHAILARLQSSCEGPGVLEASPAILHSTVLSSHETFEKEWKVVIAGHAGARAEMCQAYIQKTTMVPRRERETDDAYGLRVRDHVQLQLRFIATATQNKYDAYMAPIFRDAHQFADLYMHAQELANAIPPRSEMIDVNGRPFNLAEFAAQPFLGTGGGFSQREILAAYSYRQRGEQLFQLAEAREQIAIAPTDRRLRSISSDFRRGNLGVDEASALSLGDVLSDYNREPLYAQSAVRLNRVQEQLHHMLLRDIRVNLDRFVTFVDAFDFDGSDVHIVFQWSRGETTAKNLVKYGMSVRLQEMLAAIERRMIARGTFSIEEYDQALLDLHALLGTQGNALQTFCNELNARTPPLRYPGGDATRFVSFSYFQLTPSLDMRSTEFVENLQVPELPEPPELPAAIPNTFESSRREYILSLYETRRTARVALERRQKRLLAEAQDGTLGMTYISDRGTREVNRELAPWVIEENARREVLVYSAACNRYHGDTAEYLRLVNDYVDQTSGPGREAYILTRDTEAAFTQGADAIVRPGAFVRYPAGEELFEDQDIMPRVFGVNVASYDDNDHRVFTEVCADIQRRGVHNGLYPGYDSLHPRLLRSITFVKRPNVDGSVAYLATFSFSDHSSGTPFIMQTAVTRRGTELTFGSLVTRYIDAEGRQAFGHPAPNDTEMAIASVGSALPLESAADESGTLFRRLLGIDTLRFADQYRYNEASRRYGPEIAVLVGCTEAEAEDLIYALPREPMGYRPDDPPLVGLQIQGPGVNAPVTETRQFLATYVYASGRNLRIGFTIEPGGVYRMGPINRINDVPLPIRNRVTPRLALRSTISTAWRNYNVREVGRDAAGNPIFLQRFRNTAILTRYVPGANPGDPLRLEFQSINVETGEGALTDEGLGDTVERQLKLASAGTAVWRNAGGMGNTYRETAMKGYRNIEGSPIGDIQMDDDSQLLGYLVTMQRPELPGIPSETVDERVNRALATMGIEVNEHERRRLTEIVLTVGRQVGPEYARRVLVHGIERIAVRNEQRRVPGVTPIRAFEQLELITTGSFLREGQVLPPRSPGAEIDGSTDPLIPGLPPGGEMPS